MFVYISHVILKSFFRAYRTTKSLGCRHLKRLPGKISNRLNARQSEISTEFRKLIFTECRFKKVLLLWRCTFTQRNKAFGGIVVKDALSLSEIFTSSEPKYSLGEHVDPFLCSRFAGLQREIFKERTGKSALYEVELFEGILVNN